MYLTLLKTLDQLLNSKQNFPELFLYCGLVRFRLPRVKLHVCRHLKINAVSVCSVTFMHAISSKFKPGKKLIHQISINIQYVYVAGHYNKKQRLGLRLDRKNNNFHILVIISYIMSKHANSDNHIYPDPYLRTQNK